jgi:hypothetical protein
MEKASTQTLKNWVDVKPMLKVCNLLHQEDTFQFVVTLILLFTSILNSKMHVLEMDPILYGPLNLQEKMSLLL